MPRMALLEPTYISEVRPYRFPAGAVIDVDEPTAARWLEYNVAEPAAKTEKTYRQQRQEALLAELAELEAAKEEEAVLREAERVDVGKLRRGRRRRAPNVENPSAVVTGSSMPDVHLRRAAPVRSEPDADGDESED